MSREGSPGWNLRPWGTVRLRMTLWNVAVLALILGALGGVVRYTVQADLLATVDRTLAERAHAERDHAARDRPIIPIASSPISRPEPAARDSRPALPRVAPGGRRARGGGSQAANPASWPDLAAPGEPAVAVEGSAVGSRPMLPRLEPRIIPRDPASEPGGI